ncbi:failed axon connections homolog [Argonauta hians]
MMMRNFGPPPYGFGYGRPFSGLRFAVGVGLGVFTISGLVYMIRRWKRKKSYPKDTIIVHLFPRTSKSPNLSPFAVKLETYLRMAKLPYQVEYTREMSPKHKSPWISYNNEVIGDSQFIIEYLNARFDINLNAALSDEEKAIARAMLKMTEESLYWTAVLSRWVFSSSNPFHWMNFRMPFFIFWGIRSEMKKQTYAQGYGRHTPDEVEHIAMADLQALSDFLGQKDFLMGKEPCEYDCAVFGMVSCFRQMPNNSFFTKFLKENKFPNLKAYFNRMKDLYWPDWEAPGIKCPRFGLQPLRQ